MATRASGPALIIPAAGTGSRLGANTPKFLVPVGGRTMIARLLDLYEDHVSRIVVVVAPAAKHLAQSTLRLASDLPVDVVVQETPTGMLDAVLLAQPVVAASTASRVWITWCDQIAVDPRTIARLLSAEHDTALTMPTATRPNPYIHFDRDRDGRINAVRHRREGDAMPEIGEGDIGLFSLSRSAYLDALPEYAARNDRGTTTGERNLLPFIPWLASRAVVETFPCVDVMEAVGVNTPAELQLVEGFLRARDDA